MEAPDGQIFEAGEILGLRPALLDLDYLRVRVRELEAFTKGATLNLDADSLAILRRAADVLDKALPRSAARVTIRRLATVKLSA